MKSLEQVTREVEEQAEGLGTCFHCGFEYRDHEVIDGKGVDWGKWFCPNCGAEDSRLYKWCQRHQNEKIHTPEGCEGRE